MTLKLMKVSASTTISETTARPVGSPPADFVQQATITDATHASFAPVLAATAARPCVVAQLGQTLDSKIATTTGESRYINGSLALDHLHRLRAHVQAVVVGVGTAIADDPLLNVRRVNGPSPARVVIDPNGRLPVEARCLRDDGVPRLVIGRARRPLPDGVEQVLLPAEDGKLDPRAILAALLARGWFRILVEGGARTVSQFIDAGCIDRLHLLVAPVIMGSGRSGLELVPITSLRQALRPVTVVYPFADGDVLFDCDLRTQHESRAADGNATGNLSRLRPAR